MWIKLNITQAIKKIEFYWSERKPTKKLRGKPFNVEGKTIGQIQSIHYNKIEITTLKLYPKPEFTINWENTIILLGTNTTSPQNPIARSSTLNTSTFCGCSTQIIVLEKTPNLSSLCVLSKRKITFSFFPSVPHKALILFLQSASNLCFTLQSHSESLSLSLKPHAQALYKSFATWHS